ncbi:transposase [Deinococcus multiflagellatus]|uniref:Transposase n=1 Tax=Deinococcus multiflagellatus TaxID=1656887 RepID=A0ABW1ZSW9_9DEIO|nr:transposase [Deinococcus multiflagellatus]
MLSIGSTWTPRGSGCQFEIPTRWGSSGRINLMGCLTVEGSTTRLDVRELNGNCTGEQVTQFLDTVAQTCDPHCLTVVILDNAPFHKGAALQKKIPQWEDQGLYLRYLPPYAPMLNHIEAVWRRLKGFLMPRRCYNSVTELRDALGAALTALGARFI